MPAGRPTKYKAEFAALAETYCLMGATDEELAGFLKIDVSTLTRWKKAHPEFCTSISNGKEDADARIAASLYGKAMDGDTTACIFWLKNRRKQHWRDRQDLEHSGPGGTPLNILSYIPNPDLPPKGNDGK